MAMNLSDIGTRKKKVKVRFNSNKKHTYAPYEGPQDLISPEKTSTEHNQTQLDTTRHNQTQPDTTTHNRTQPDTTKHKEAEHPESQKLDTTKHNQTQLNTNTSIPPVKEERDDGRSQLNTTEHKSVPLGKETKHNRTQLNTNTPTPPIKEERDDNRSQRNTTGHKSVPLRKETKHNQTQLNTNSTSNKKLQAPHSQGIPKGGNSNAANISNTNQIRSKNIIDKSLDQSPPNKKRPLETPSNNGRKATIYTEHNQTQLNTTLNTTEHKYSTQLNTTEHKPHTTEHKLNTPLNTTEHNQTQENDVNFALSSLTGNRKKIIVSLCRYCTENCCIRLDDISYQALADLTGVKLTSIKTTIQRLKKEGLLEVVSPKGGRGALLSLIPEDALLQNYIKSLADVHQNREKLNTLLNTNGPSSSSYINNKTTTNYEELMDINFSGLLPFGFHEGKLEQIAKRKIFKSSSQLQQILDYLEFYLNSEESKGIKDPLSWIMKQLNSGHFSRPRGYQSRPERAYTVYLKEKEEEQQRVKDYQLRLWEAEPEKEKFYSQVRGRLESEFGPEGASVLIEAEARKLYFLEIGQEIENSNA